MVFSKGRDVHLRWLSGSRRLVRTEQPSRVQRLGFGALTAGFLGCNARGRAFKKTLFKDEMSPEALFAA